MQSVLQIQEYGDPTPLIEELANIAGYSLQNAEWRLRLAGEAAQRKLGLRYNPIEIVGAGVRVGGIAGVIGIDNRVDLEVVPKYANPADGTWRQDMLFLLLLVRHGELLLANAISASTLAQGDLSELAGELIVRLYLKNRYLPLQTRKKVTLHSFGFESDIDPDDLLNPTDEGFEQQEYARSRSNPFAATISAAAAYLSTRAKSSTLERQLQMVAREGLARGTVSPIRLRLPAKLTRWQLLYDFCFDILQARTLSPGLGRFRMPGFVIGTWQTWQAVVERALRLGFGARVHHVQASFPLGSRLSGSKAESIAVTPDNVVVIGSENCVVDAKYKGRFSREFDGISSSDLYESLAFMQGVGSKKTFLIYPDTRITSVTGQMTVVEKAMIGQREVSALLLSVNKISQPGALLAFSNGLRHGLLATVTPIAAAA